MSYQSFLIRITPQSNLILGTRSGWSNFQNTLEHIPGSFLRGAIGERLFQQARETYNHVFDTKPEPLFGYAYPGSYGPIFPLPLTARSCKRYPGFWQERNIERQQEEQHGIYDHLIADFVYELVSDPQFPARTTFAPELGTRWSEDGWWLDNHPNHSCPKCREEFENCQKAFEECQETCEECQAEFENCRSKYDKEEDMTAETDGRYYAWQDGVRAVDSTFAIGRTTHVGINRARSVAEDSLLFTEEHLTTGEQSGYFFSWFHIPTEKVDLVRPLFDQTYAIGRGRSRGMGQIRLEETPLPDSYPPLTRRLRNFQRQVGHALTAYRTHEPRLPDRLSGQLFTITLNAPAILEEAGEALRTPSQRQLQLPAGVQHLRSWARTEEVGGWDQGAGLPRRTQLAVRAGSTYLYYAPPEIETTILENALTRLETEGVGEERERGYGQLTVCAPFHTYQRRY